eukprot:gnl/TRDRNA2_/TRDRNA2_134399_c0_seq1.p1 gnl/TRDRNA2_/TRDRNA2_134399_c0~~gnl/TRDRNA2_/TRDRNA2_134399_c0_seq1.p1  ORF type:complete len:846 (+),score=154.00 gnl/TRDRNA2_/TRDRNA2_134399_c0_seq1:76-2613(+)
MSAEFYRKIKAVLLIAMLAGAEVQQVQQGIHLNTYSSLQPSSSASDASGFGTNSGVHDWGLGSMMASPILEGEGKLLAEQLEGIMADPSLQRQAKHVIENVEAMMADQHLQEQAARIAEQIDAFMADRIVQEHAKALTEQVEALMADRSLQEQAKRVAEEMELTKADPSSQDSANRIVEQMDMMMANPSLQEHAKRITEQMEAIAADPSLEEHAKRAAEQMEATMTELEGPAKNLAHQLEAMASEPNLQRQVKRIANQMETMMTDPSLQMHAQHVAEQMELNMNDATFQEQAKHVAEQMEAAMTDSNADEQAKLFFEQMETRMPDMFEKTNSNKNRVKEQEQDDSLLESRKQVEDSMDNKIDESASKLVDRLTKGFPSHQADLDRTTLGKANKGKDINQRFRSVKSMLPEFKSTVSAISDFSGENYLSFALTAVIFIALICPVVGQKLAAPVSPFTIGNWKMTPTILLSYLLFLQGMSLKTDEIKKVGSKFWFLLYGVLAQLVIGGLMSIPINYLPFLTHELRLGFMVWCNMGLTLSLGAAFTASAGGDGAFALLLTVISNFLGTVTIPFAYQYYMSHFKFGGTKTIDVNPYVLMRHYAGTVPLQIILGKAVSMIPGVSKFMEWKSTKAFVKYTSQTALAIMPMIAMSLSSASIYAMPTKTFLAAVATAFGIHLGLLFIHYFVTYFMLFPVGIRKAIMFVTFRKTLPFCVISLGLMLNPAVSPKPPDCAIACIIGRYVQFVVGMAMASRIKAWDQTWEHGPGSSIDSSEQNTEAGKRRRSIDGSTSRQVALAASSSEQRISLGLMSIPSVALTAFFAGTGTIFAAIGFRRSAWAVGEQPLLSGYV